VKFFCKLSTSTDNISPSPSNPPEGGWTTLIDELCAGTWRHPDTGDVCPPAPYDNIVMAEDLYGLEAQLVTDVGMDAPYTVVADEQTWEAMGRRIAKALRSLGAVDEIIFKSPHASLSEVENLKQKLVGATSVIAVGSGSVNDLCKHATFQLGLRYSVFGTAASMNGYTSKTASMALESGLKVSLASHAPAGFFVDLKVSAEAPPYLAAAGFGDCLCRSVAQIDWWMSHRLFDTPYFEEPYLIEIPDEKELNSRAHLLPAGDITAIGYLHRVLTLCGLGMAFTNSSHHGSMGEHQVSHYIDCFAGKQHPGTLHGQQVGVASITMARIQQHFLSSKKPPVIEPTRIDPDGMARRMGPEIAEQCLVEYQKKALDVEGAAIASAKLAEIWPELRRECLEMSIPAEELRIVLEASGGPTTASTLGVPVDFYREAVCHAHEMRNRFSFVDIASNAGILKDMAAGET